MNSLWHESAAPTDVDDPIMLEATRLAERLADTWQRGVGCRAEELLAEHPAIADHPRAAMRVIYEEVCQREQRGQDVPLTELCARFPRWQEELAVVRDCHRLLDLLPPAPRFPNPGEVLGEFRLLAELGRGGMGRVYLAEQAFLAGRRTILKLTPAANQEHLKLARLQHTHIVPLYSVRDCPERHLRKLCMPCLGGATLQQLLRRLQPIPPERRTGGDLLDALPASVADPRLFWLAPGPNRRFLERASYVQAVCWIGVCLADALHYAHEQGLVHLDVKPSNVLLTADCQPMLLDFHLAHGPIPVGPACRAGPGSAERDLIQPDLPWLGGTPGYMAPEQYAAWRAVRNRQPLVTAVDARADVYALGILLRELLYGYDPASESAAALGLPRRGDVSVGLSDILARCLRPDPGARYPTAALVADDLRRHLTHRTLAGVRNRSIAERWSKWRRRRPHALLVWLLSVVCLGTIAAFAGLYAVQAAHHREAAQAALIEGHRQLDQHHYSEAVRTFERALAQPGAGSLQAELLRHRQRAARAHDIKALHRQVENTRYLHGDDFLAPTTVQALAAQCRSVWQDRDRLLAHDDEPLDAALEETLRRDLVDVAVLWVDCRLRLAGPADIGAVRKEALAILDEAEAICGSSPVLSRQRQALGGVAGAERAPRTAWEHYMLGRWLLRAGDVAGAAQAFDRAVDMRPQDFWPWFGKGLCAHRQHRSDAVTAFTVCIALAPDSAACYHNRGLALAAHGDPAGALRDYDRALQLDPRLAVTALNRAALHLQERRLDRAAADLQLALSLGANPAAVHYNWALVHQARQEPAAALASIEQALQHDPQHGPSRELALDCRSNRRKPNAFTFRRSAGESVPSLAHRACVSHKPDAQARVS